MKETLGQNLVHDQTQKKTRFGEHDETQKKARFGARRNAEKSTIWSTTKRRKKHDLAHEEMEQQCTKCQEGIHKN